MVDFKEQLEKASNEASKLPSFPQKNVTYNIDAQNPDLSPHEDWQESENQWGKMVKRKQTVYYVNTKEGVLRISPNQLQQLNECLANVPILRGQEWITVNTEDSAHGLVFVLPPTPSA